MLPRLQCDGICARKENYDPFLKKREKRTIPQEICFGPGEGQQSHDLSSSFPEERTVLFCLHHQSAKGLRVWG